MRYFLIIALMALAACGTPEQRCAKGLVSELDTLDRLIAETEANLARGYSYRVEPAPVSWSVGGCVNRFNSTRFCGWNDTQYRREAVAIDPQAEQRKLDQLQRRKAALEANLNPALEACGITLVNDAPTPG